MKTAAATDVKNRFGDYLGEILRSQEPLFIERHGKTVAVLVDVRKWLQTSATRAAHSKTPWCDGLRKLLKKSRRKDRARKFTRGVDLLRQIRDENS